jgi:hypothetical protein
LTLSHDFARKLNEVLHFMYDAAGDNMTLPTLVLVGVRDLAIGVHSERWASEVSNELLNVPFVLSVSQGLGDKVALSLVDILIAHHTPGFQIRKCFVDGRWFVPSSRSRVNRFCSARCRKSFNDEVKSAVELFCPSCSAVFDLAGFSGLGGNRTLVGPTTIKADNPWCIACVKRTFSEWNDYLLLTD